MCNNLNEAVSKATAVALSLHKMIEEHEKEYNTLTGQRQLTLHAGIGCGECFGQVVGGVLGRWDFILSGEGVSQIAVAEPAAGPTETVVSPQSWAYLATDFDGEELTGEYEGFVRILGEKLSESESESDAPPNEDSWKRNIGSHDQIQLKPKHICFMPTYLPNAVIMNLKAGVCDSTSQAEMRELSVMFIQLTNLDTEDNSKTQSAIQCVQEATYQVEGEVEGGKRAPHN